MSKASRCSAVTTDRGQVRTLSLVVAAASACFVGIGISRFAYTPLIPALVNGAWFSASEAAYLQAANFAGYLMGAWLAGRAGLFSSTANVLRCAMVMVSLSFILCAWPLGFSWFTFWRFAAGAGGALLMIIATVTAMSLAPLERRATVGGFAFAGVGLGVVASGTLVPILLESGLRATWFSFGTLSFALAVLTWNLWPEKKEPAIAEASPDSSSLQLKALRVLYLQYALSAIGVVPHMIFLVDFVARGLDRGVTEGSHYWIAFGIGATLGPMLAGRVADQIGVAYAVRAALMTSFVCVGVLVIWNSAPALLVSSLLVGACVPGVPALVSARTQELVPAEVNAKRAVWAKATLYFAIGQAGGAYLLSYAFSRSGGSYLVVFAIGTAALALAVAAEALLFLNYRRSDRAE
jgi:predicted MFS family arabinose efflux permease